MQKKKSAMQKARKKKRKATLSEKEKKFKEKFRKELKESREFLKKVKGRMKKLREKRKAMKAKGKDAMEIELEIEMMKINALEIANHIQQIRRKAKKEKLSDKQARDLRRKKRKVQDLLARQRQVAEKIRLYYNPAALRGKRRKIKLLEQGIERLRMQGVDVRMSSSLERAERIRDELDEFEKLEAEKKRIAGELRKLR